MDKSLYPAVEQRKFKSSWKDLSTTVRTTSALCFIQPVLHRQVYPDDYWKIRIKSFIESFPLETAMSGSFEVNYDFFFEPMSNLYGYIDNNVKVPTEYILEMNRHRLSYYGGYTATDVNTLNNPYAPNFMPFNSTLGIIAGTIPTFDSVEFHPNPATTSYLRYSPDSVAAGSLLNYLGYPAGYRPYYVTNSISTTPSEFEFMEDIVADPFFAYIDVARYWYFNHQSNYVDFYFPAEFETGSYPTTPGTSTSTISTTPGYYRWSVSQQIFDALFMGLRSLPDGTNFGDFKGLSSSWFSGPFGRTLYDVSTTGMYIVPYKWNVAGKNDGYPYSQGEIVMQTTVFNVLNQMIAASSQPNGGMFVCTYKMDMYRGMLSPYGGTYRATIDSSGNTIEMQDVWYANRMEQMINMFDMSNGRFTDWAHRLWGVKPKGNSDIPHLLGSFRYDLTFNDVTATTGASTPEGSQSLGQQASIAASGGSSREIRFKSDTYGTLLCCFYIRPKVAYSTGIWPEDQYFTFADMYNPFMQDVGFVDVPNSEVLAVLPKQDESGPSVPWLPTIDINNQESLNYLEQRLPGSVTMGTSDVIGRRLIWTEADTAIDRNYGQFSAYGQLSRWVMNRPYTQQSNNSASLLNGSVYDYSVYMNPAYFNLPFAYQAAGSQNFRCIHRFEISCYRKKGRRDAPHM